MSYQCEGIGGTRSSGSTRTSKSFIPAGGDEVRKAVLLVTDPLHDMSMDM